MCSGLSQPIFDEVVKVNKRILYNLRIHVEAYARHLKMIRHGAELIFLVFKCLGFGTIKIEILGP